MGLIVLRKRLVLSDRLGEIFKTGAQLSNLLTNPEMVPALIDMCPIFQRERLWENWTLRNGNMMKSEVAIFVHKKVRFGHNNALTVLRKIDPITGHYSTNVLHQNADHNK